MTSRSVTKTVLVNTSDNTQKEYKITYTADSDGHVDILVAGVNPWINASGGAMTVDGAVNSTNRNLAAFATSNPGSTQSIVAAQLAEIVARDGPNELAKLSQEVGPSPALTPEQDAQAAALDKAVADAPAVQSPSPPALVIPAADAALNRAADDKARADYASASPAEKRAIEDTTRLTARQLGGDETVQDKKVPETNLAQNAATTNEAVQDKKVPTDDPAVGRTLGGASIDNPTPKATEVDEDSAYPKNPVDVAAAEKIKADLGITPGAASRGLTVDKENTNSQGTQQDAANSVAAADWRVRLSLAKDADYLYKNKGNEGILLPLAATNGVIFPYTPAIQVQYAATYDPNELTHSNYKFYSYKGSAVDSINITCDFTAQDTAEANYLLAVIHFFRTVTKMFYGKDQTPRNGTPPPLCYLSGLGTYQFDNHPLAITGFTYTLPTDVDYIRAQSAAPPPGVSTAPQNVPSSNSNSISVNRAHAAGTAPGALAAPPVFNNVTSVRQQPTYVPTKISIAITAVPIVTRNDITNNFSLREYGTGALLRGTQRKSGGGIW